MKPGDLLLAPLPQVDGRLKDRPVLLLCVTPPFDDCLVCGISTQLQTAVDGLDAILCPADEDFDQTGLKAASVIRVTYLALLPRSYFKGRIGAVSALRLRAIITSLVGFLSRACEVSQ
jgi:mRNA interferase MazF